MTGGPLCRSGQLVTSGPHERTVTSLVTRAIDGDRAGWNSTKRTAPVKKPALMSAPMSGLISMFPYSGLAQGYLL